LREIQNEPYFKELDKKNLKKYLWENENKYDKLDKVFRKMHQMNHK